jgi:DNA-binding CsgD family transcriptional regulator
MDQRFASESMAARPDSLNFGICIKDQDWTIQHQNAACISICGNKVGTVCQETCWRLNRSNCVNEEQEVGIKAFKNKGFQTNTCDVAMVFQEDRITSVIFQLNHESQKEAAALKVRGLTDREREIFQLRKHGFKNIEIEHLLRIKRATLKTHIRNILKKVSSE